MPTEIELETEKGQSRMFAIDGVAPWTDVGVAVKDAPKDVAGMLERLGLNWNVATEPLYRKNAAGLFVKVRKAACTVRGDTDACLGFGGSDFHAVQNWQFIETALALSGEAKIIRGGELQDGKTVFAQLKYPKEWEVAGQKHEAMVFLSNGHAWNRSMTIGLTDQDIVCLNSLNFAERQAAASGKIIRFSHTKGLGERMKVVAEMMHGFGESFARHFDGLGALAAEKVSAKTRERYFATVTAARGGSEARGLLFQKQLEERWVNGRGQQERGDTLYRAFSAVTDAVDHHVRPSYVSSPTNKRVEGRFLEATFGSGASLKRRALKIALDYVGAASAN